MLKSRRWLLASTSRKFVLSTIVTCGNFEYLWRYLITCIPKCRHSARPEHDEVIIASLCLSLLG